MTTLDNLRKTAKRWLRALRANEAEARARLERAYPNAPSAPSLRDVQHALARECGHETWTALKSAVLRQAPVTPVEPENQHAERVAAFLNYACPDWRMGGGPSQVMHRHTAERLLRRYPEIQDENLFTRIVCGDLAGVQRIVAERPEAVLEKGGPKDWPSLLYLCAGRLSLPAFSENAVAIARTLLDRGADPNTYYFGGNESIHYTALTCVIGRGEEAAPLHPQAEAIAELLLERGAEPYDTQVFYNISQGHLNDEAIWLLELIYQQSIRAGRAADWADPEWSMIDEGGYGLGARFVLEHALRGNHLKLAQWALDHGASANAIPARDPRWSKRSLYEEALRRGLTEMADLLARYGATTSVPALEGEDAFLAACFRLDRAAADRLLDAHPEYRRWYVVMHEAARLDRADVATFLIDSGVSTEVEDPKHKGQRALHVAAYAGSARVARLLIDRGAEVDPVDEMHDGTPLWWAMYGRRQATIEVLSPLSRDLWALTRIGNVERLRELLAADPARAKARGESTPLMWLPDDEARASAIVDLFLAHGADPSIARKDGATASDLARRRGLDDAAAKLEAAARTQSMPDGTGPQPDAQLDTNVERYERLASDLAVAHGSGDEAALQRISAHYGRRVTWDDVRAEVWHRARYSRPGGRSGPLSLDDAKDLVAREAGFNNWTAFAAAVAAGARLPGGAYIFDAKESIIRPRRALDPHDWEAVVAAMRERRISKLDAGGHMTDAALERISELDHVTHLQIGGSRQLTDAGLRHLARMPQLQELDLGGYPGGVISDRGLEVLQHLPALRRFHIAWESGISDVGVANLKHCEQLASVDLMGTATGDGAIRALAGKRALDHLKTGRLLTDAALPLLHELPAFKTWKPADVWFHLMGPTGEPNQLTLDGPITNEGLRSLAGLEGLFALNLFWHVSALTPAGLGRLIDLPNLCVLGCEGKLCDDEAMRHIAALPALRGLMAQGTVATDEGFIALSRSQTIESIWGRECPHLTGRGFAALARMPALRGLALSCKRVDDAALAQLPRFPALVEFLAMDVPDDGFRHVGRCERLEMLWCMYCRNTTDAATEHIAGLSRLKFYYAGSTQITDRSLEILGRLTSLERIELNDCKGITDAGLLALRGLPKLREISLGGLPNVTLEGTAVFPPQVRVNYSVSV